MAIFICEIVDLFMVKANCYALQFVPAPLCEGKAHLKYFDLPLQEYMDNHCTSAGVQSQAFK